MKNAFQMTLIIIALLLGSMVLGKLILNPSKPLSTQTFSQETQKNTTASNASMSMPEVSLPRIYPDNGTLSLINHRGKYLLINFWASWCTPCITEMPDLFALAKASPSTFELMAFSIDTKKEKAESFFRTLIKKFDAGDAKNIYAAWDQRAQISQNRFGTFQVPESYLVSPEGVIVKKYPGALDETALSEIRELIQ